PASERGHSKGALPAIRLPRFALAPRGGAAVPDPLAHLVSILGEHHERALDGGHGAVGASGVRGASRSLGAMAAEASVRLGETTAAFHGCEVGAKDDDGANEAAENRDRSGNRDEAEGGPWTHAGMKTRVKRGCRSTRANFSVTSPPPRASPLRRTPLPASSCRRADSRGRSP